MAYLASGNAGGGSGSAMRVLLGQSRVVERTREGGAAEIKQGFFDETEGDEGLE